MAENSGNQVYSHKHWRTCAQWSYCVRDRGRGGRAGEAFQASPSCLRSERKKKRCGPLLVLLLVNKHLDQVSGGRLPHSAWLFAAGVALMPAVMNQARLFEQLKGNQIYTLHTASRSHMLDWSLQTRGARTRCLFGFHFIQKTSAPVTSVHLSLMTGRSVLPMGWRQGNNAQREWHDFLGLSLNPLASCHSSWVTALQHHNKSWVISADSNGGWMFLSKHREEP